MTHSRNSRVRAACMVVGCLAVGSLAISCGSDDATPSAGQSGGVCDDAKALSSSVDSLKDVDLKAEGTNGVDTAVASVKDDLTALGDSASEALQPDVEAVQDAVSELETAAASIDTDGIAPTATAVASVATSTRTLVDKIEAADC